MEVCKWGCNRPLSIRGTKYKLILPHRFEFSLLLHVFPHRDLDLLMWIINDLQGSGIRSRSGRHQCLYVLPDVRQPSQKRRFGKVEINSPKASMWAVIRSGMWEQIVSTNGY